MRASLEWGKGSSEAEEVSLSSQASSGGLGQGLLGSWGGGYVTMGGLLPDSFKQKAIACWGERSSHQRDGRGADSLGNRAHLREGERKALSPVPSPWPSSALPALRPALGIPAPPSLEGPYRAASMQGNLPSQKTQAPAWEGMQR